jgi:hypothetical protein
MSGRDLALTGIPRGGTTLACRLLGLCDDTVALFEPMDVRRLPRQDRDGAADAIAGFFRDARAQLLHDGSAPSKQRDGQVPDNPFGARDDHGERQQQVSIGRLQLPALPRPDFTLVVKHNAAFAALLPQLAARFETLAIVRHPLAVLASWNSVALPVRDGRVPAGERLDPALAQRLDATSDRTARQLLVLDWFFARFAHALPRERVLRYEDIVATQGDLLRERARLRGTSDVALAERNASALYRGTDVAALQRALVDHAGAWQAWYPPDEITALARRMQADTP